MAKAEGTALLKIGVVYSPAPRQVREWTLEFASGTTVSQALAASGISKEFPELQMGRPALGIWGRKTAPGHVLQEGIAWKSTAACVSTPRLRAGNDLTGRA